MLFTSSLSRNSPLDSLDPDSFFECSAENNPESSGFLLMLMNSLLVFCSTALDSCLFSTSFSVGSSSVNTTLISSEADFSKELLTLVFFWSSGLFGSMCSELPSEPLSVCEKSLLTYDKII